MTYTKFTQSGSANRWAVGTLTENKIATASRGRSGRITITPVEGRELSPTEALSIVEFLSESRA